MISPELTPEAASAKAWSSIWTFPLLMGSAFLVAWGAEAAQFLVSRGLALAMLAWLQTLPEFAVEAAIAWEQDIPLMTANFTGSLRLLTGVGWPMIFFVSYFSSRRRGAATRRIRLGPEYSIEVMGLPVPLLYFWVIYFKGTLTLWDSAILIALYVGYLATLYRLPPRDSEDMEDVPRISRWVLGLPGPGKALGVLGLFAGGGLILYLVAGPFLHSMLGLAAVLGVSQFVFVQWVSPFLSEFPEKVSAFNWARQRSKAPMALMNMVSSNINQWTVLVAMIPMVYCLSVGSVASIHFDAHQKSEILLTMAQAYVGFMLLANLEFSWYEAVGLFVLWFVQFVAPHSREEITVIYWAWFLIEVGRAISGHRRMMAARSFFPLLRQVTGLGKSR
jgi:cation:H+ antiporter